MKKLLAVLCILAALSALAWKGVSSSMTLAPAPSVTMIGPDGSVRPQTVQRAWVTLPPARATIGANLLVTPEGVELVGGGGLSVGTPLAVLAETVFSWLLICLTLVAGVCLFRSKNAS